MRLDLFAGIRVRDYVAARSWYERLLRREPAFFPHATEAVWELAEHRYLFIEENREAPGGAMITIFVDDLDALTADVASRGIEPAEQVTYSKWCAKSDLPRRRRQQGRLRRGPRRAVSATAIGGT
jgi:hypothetical protein